MNHRKHTGMTLKNCLFVEIQRRGRAAVETVEFPSDGTLSLEPIADVAFTLPYVRKVEIRPQVANSGEALWGQPFKDQSKRHTRLADEGQLEADLRAVQGDATVEKMYTLRRTYLQEQQ